MQTEPNAKQQIVERIKNSTNILVTVGNNPSVDALSAALSLTLMLNRLDKHATAVFSGEVPPAISFLEPDKTFENTVDSLRDFIIALDKEKADRLRYKVEDDVVRIFITPYRTVINEKDLQFSQGDFNVELIIALGVEKREDLDTAITAHGRILHDATVVTINSGGMKSTLGSLDWSDTNASSLCEMLMSLSEALQAGLLDQQIATAVLTGIVAATDRFRNEHTSPRVMTMAAQLMAAGANQQLIAAKLEEGHGLPSAEPAQDGSTALSEGKSQKVNKPKKAKDDGALEIDHDVKPDAEPLPDPSAEALKEAENELAESLEKAAPASPTLSVDDLKNDLDAAAQDVDEAANSAVNDQPKVIKQEHRTWRSDMLTDKPSFGGTLNATASDAEEAKREEALAHRNQTILSHDDEAGADESPQEVPVAAGDTFVSPEPVPPPVEPADLVPPVPAFQPPEPVGDEPPVDEPVAKPIESTADDALSFEPAPISSGPTLAELDSQTRGKAAEDARAAIDAALASMPFDPAGKPLQSSGAAPALNVQHDNEPVPAPVEPQASPMQPPVVPSGAPDLPPLPDFSTLPPLPDDTPAPEPSEPAPLVPPTQVPDVPPPAAGQPPLPQTPTPADPGQFKIPGQP